MHINKHICNQSNSFATQMTWSLLDLWGSEPQWRSWKCWNGLICDVESTQNKTRHTSMTKFSKRWFCTASHVGVFPHTTSSVWWSMWQMTTMKMTMSVNVFLPVTDPLCHDWYFPERPDGWSRLGYKHITAVQFITCICLDLHSFRLIHFEFV